MDDGLQNPWLAKDLRLLVIDGSFGFGNRRLLPAGPLRGPIAEGLARVSAVIRIGADRAGIGALLPPGLPCLEADLGQDDDAPTLAGRKVLAFAGIGHPEKFFASLESAGAEIVRRRSFADHHPYRRAEALAFEAPPRGVAGALQTAPMPITSAAGAAGRAPSAWRAGSAPRRSSAPPSDNRPAGPISRGTVPASCRTACADGA